MSSNRPHDPRTAHHDEPFGEQQIDHPGLTGELDPRPDHGEDSYRGSGRMEGRRALITGGDSGIGRATAIAFAREGADVVFSCLDAETDDAEQTLDLIRSAGRHGAATAADLSDERTSVDLVGLAERELGGLDVVVNNAAHQMSLDDGILSLSTSQLERTFATNVFALFWICRAAVPILPAGSAIVNVASIQARQPSPHLMDYAATKAAIVNITTNLAQQVADRGIRVNAVAPGPIWTPLIPATMPPEAVDSFGQDTPIGRAGQPAEVAPAMVFLASDEASYITGETLAVTGGRAFT